VAPIDAPCSAIALGPSALPWPHAAFYSAPACRTRLRQHPQDTSNYRSINIRSMHDDESLLDEQTINAPSAATRVSLHDSAWRKKAQVQRPPSRHRLSKSMTLSTSPGSAYRRRCDSRILSGSPPFSAQRVCRCQRCALAQAARCLEGTRRGCRECAAAGAAPARKSLMSSMARWRPRVRQQG
jgi:hypothetical protein